MSKRAMELAVEEINAKGGIKSLNGAKLQLVFADSQGKPQVGVSEAERLLTQEKVTLLTGSYQSGVTLPASEVAERYKKVWFASVPSDDSITSRGFKYVFRLADTSAMRVDSQVKFLEDLKKRFSSEIKTAALVYENTSYGQSVAKAWKEKLPKAGYQIVLDEAYDKGASDLTPVVNKVKSASPDVVLLTSYVADATLLVKGFHQQKVTPKAFIGTSGGYADPEFIKNAGEAALNIFDVAAWEVDVNRPFSKETDKKFFEKHKVHMNGEAVKEYAGIYVIADALERAKSTDSEKLREALASTNITEGPTQMYTNKIHFDKTGTLPDPGLVMVQFQKVDGKVERVTVWPKEDARSGSKIVFPYQAQ
ncbi:ABC transporter substrate-binding protein [Effusibacillus lacus]|uniref:ABC transporter substrate-binding protein n=2 Tax=Effusibacillus lacus TaxID=1348429 RepID=A0A292YKH5_9BACL|nr:ABC transporter substrate-binding protein [Effusibacillus lacus]